MAISDHTLECLREARASRRSGNLAAYRAWLAAHGGAHLNSQRLKGKSAMPRGYQEGYQAGRQACRQPAKGFTLIELMMVVAVIAIIAAVGYPSYGSYVIRTNRSVAQQFMMNIANRQEQYLLDARAYTATIGSGGLNLAAPAELATRYTFAVAIDAGPPPTYTITATAIGGQATDGNLTLNSLGVKAPADKWTGR